MTILGVYYGHNATVTLYKDGEVLESVSEERFTGIKNQAGTITTGVPKPTNRAGTPAQPGKSTRID